MTVGPRASTEIAKAKISMKKDADRSTFWNNRQDCRPFWTTTTRARWPTYLGMHVYRKSIIGSAEALPILCVRCARWEREIQREKESERERERERLGSDVTLVAQKLAMNFAPFLAKRWNWWWILHLSLPNAEIGDEFCTFPLPKNLHLSIGEEFCTFPCQKFAP